MSFTQDRRRFFRIDDQLRLDIRRTAAEARERGGDAAVSEMARIDRRIELIINAARVQAPAVAELGELLNEKLNRVLEMVGMDEELAMRMQFPERKVNLSACGLGVTLDLEFRAGEEVEIEMLLAPAETRLRLGARVVRCVARDQGGYLLHLDFTGVRPEEQEVLIQYILRRQNAWLQDLRNERKPLPFAG